MAAFLGNLRNVVVTGFVLAALLALLYLSRGGSADATFWAFITRWLHIASGVMWIGLLWYFNFVSAPTMPKIPAELKPALGKYITPAALFWFRWSAMGTIVLGVIFALRQHYLLEAFSFNLLGDPAMHDTKTLIIGIGMWLGTIMWFNVWFVIWPNQQKALNIGDKYASLDAAAKAASAATAGMFSRINTMLSIPMLFCMAAAPHLA